MESQVDDPPTEDVVAVEWTSGPDPGPGEPAEPGNVDSVALKRHTDALERLARRLEMCIVSYETNVKLRQTSQRHPALSKRTTMVLGPEGESSPSFPVNLFQDSGVPTRLKRPTNLDSGQRNSRRSLATSDGTSSIKSDFSAGLSTFSTRAFRGIRQRIEGELWDFDNEDNQRRATAIAKGIRTSCAHSSPTILEGLKEPDFCAYFQAFVGNVYFEVFWAILILTNAVLAGVQVQFASQKADKTEFSWDSGMYLQWTYTVLFFMEFVLRLAAGRSDFFCGKHWIWNIFDMCVSIVSSVEMATEIQIVAQGEAQGGARDGASNNSMGVIHIIRITRLVRIFRIVRIMRFSRSLRNLVHSIICTLRSLMWAMILLAMIIYVFGILFCQAINEHLEFDGREDGVDYDRYWGSMPRSMLTLFQAMTNGVTWDLCVRPLQHAGSRWVFLFVAYISFTFFAVLNVITGVFCQSAIEGAQNDQDMLIAEQLKNKVWYEQQVREVFQKIDADNSGTISVQELEDSFIMPEMKAYLSALQLDTDDAWNLFKLLDNGENQQIDQHDFVAGCMRLKGSAKAIDMAQLLQEVKIQRKQLVSFMGCMENQIKAETSFRPSHPPFSLHHSPSLASLEEAAGAGHGRHNPELDAG